MADGDVLSLTHDGDLYEARRVSGKWEITRTPQTPFFPARLVEVTDLPPDLYDQFTTYFLRVSHREHSKG
jgi:hypothetical protein